MRLAGLWPALLTPLHPGGGLDIDALAALVEDLVPRGIDGLVPLGSTGEFTEFDRSERRTIVETVVAAARGRVPVLAGVSGLSTVDTCRYAEDAVEAGAAAVLVLPPLYWKVPDELVVEHVLAVADAAGRPVVVYDFPALTGQPVSPGVLGRLAAEEPRVVGAKLTVRDIITVRDALAATRPRRPDFAVVVGFEDLIPAALWAGADGAISGMANIAPDLLVELVDAVRADRPEAAALHRRVMALFGVYALSTPAIPGVKAAAAALGRIPQPTWRVPAGPEEAILKAAATWAAAVRE